MWAAGPASASESASPATPSLFSTTGQFAAPEYSSPAASSPAYSSSSIAVDPISEERASLSADPALPQPPYHHRTYGHSRYQDRWHNADGSSKIAFVIGAGADVPTGKTADAYTENFAMNVGAGINFNRNFGVLGEFGYYRMGIAGRVLDTIYTDLINSGVPSSQLAGFDGNAHLYSLSLDPIVNVGGANSNWGGYVTGGLGYYHRATNFTVPALSGGCGYYCYSYYTNQNISSVTDNGFGLNLGGGLTYRLGEFSNKKLFIDARYNWAKFNSSNTASFADRNATFIPAEFGLRF